MLSAITKSIIENKDAIKEALDNTLTPISKIVCGINGFLFKEFLKLYRVIMTSM